MTDIVERARDPEFCPICGGDCAGANPPVYNCPNECSHPWAAQDQDGRPACAVCGIAWSQTRKREPPR